MVICSCNFHSHQALSTHREPSSPVLNPLINEPRQTLYLFTRCRMDVACFGHCENRDQKVGKSRDGAHKVAQDSDSVDQHQSEDLTLLFIT